MKTEIVEKLAALIAAAFGLVAALAWNTAIQQIFKNMFGDQSSTAAMVTYAVIVTILAVLATIWIGRVAGRTKKTEA